jgi:hypothetical protein
MSCEYVYDLSGLDLNKSDIIKKNKDLKNTKVHKNTNENNIDHHNFSNKSEYTDDIELILLENNIINLISLIIELDDESKFLEYDLSNTIKNIIIINNKRLRQIYHKNKLINIEKALYSIEHFYSKKILIEMINNIKRKSCNESYNMNILHRNIYKVSSKYPPINSEERINIEQNLPQFRKLKQFKKHPISFNVDEIVGVKSVENKWFLGRVLHKYTDITTGNDWYYVKIEGMPDICNFWINSITYRIQKFKSKKHFLSR